MEKLAVVFYILYLLKPIQKDNYIKELSKDGVITTSNQFIPVSRNVFKEIKKAYINYSF